MEANAVELTLTGNVEHIPRLLSEFYQAPMIFHYHNSVPPTACHKSHELVKSAFWSDINTSVMN